MDNLINTQGREVVNKETSIVDEKVINKKLSEVSSDELIKKYGIIPLEVGNLASILDYGNDTLEQIGSLFEATAHMTVATSEKQITDLEIKKISSFSEYLDEKDKKIDKEDPALLKTVKGVLTKLRIIKPDADEKKYSYQSEFSEYVKNLQDVCNKVLLSEDNSRQDIQMRNDLYQDVSPLLEKVQAEAILGFRSIEEYRKETEILASNPDCDKNEIMTREVLLQAAEVQVGENYKACASFAQTLNNFKLEQVKEGIIITKQKQFYTKTKPLLIAQGSTVVFEHGQKRRAQMLLDLQQAANDAIDNNSKEIAASSEKIAKLMEEGTLSVESLKNYQDAIIAGYEVLDNARDNVEKRLITDQQVLKEINETAEISRSKSVKLASLLEESGLLGKEKKLGKRK